MAQQKLQIKRNTTNANAPSALAGGELAHTNSTNTLYVGDVNSAGVSILSDSQFVSNNGTDIIVLHDSDSSNTVTLKVPSNLTENLILQFPKTIPAEESNRILHGQNSGELELKGLSVETLSEIEDIDDAPIQDGDVLTYDSTDGEWKHITLDAFKSLFGFGEGTTTYNNMIVNGKLIVHGNTEFDSQDLLIRDKTLVLGVSGGVSEHTVDSNAGGVLTVTNTDRTFTTGELYWVEGVSIDSGIYSVSADATNTNVGFTYTGSYDNTADDAILISKSVVSDMNIDGAGFQLVGDDVANPKSFKWNNSVSSGVNPFFHLNGGDLVLNKALYIEDMKIIEMTTNGSKNILHPDIEVNISQLSLTELDGGTY